MKSGGPWQTGDKNIDIYYSKMERNVKNIRIQDAHKESNDNFISVFAQHPHAFLVIGDNPQNSGSVLPAEMAATSKLNEWI